MSKTVPVRSMLRAHRSYPGRVDLDLRLVRAFVAVADERHFGRAAERLHLAQPAVSRQVRRLEAQLGARLLDRTSRSVALTDEGRGFLDDARGLLAAADAAVRRLAGARSLTVGFLPGLTPTPAVRALRRAHPGVPVAVRRVEWSDQGAALRDGRVDVVVGRLPLDGAGLCVEALYDEPRILLLPADHPLAGKEQVSILDVAGEPMVRHTGPGAEAWDAYWATDPRPDGSRATWGPVVRGVEEKLEQVAAGQALTVLPLSAGTAYVRPDVRTVRLTDVPDATVVLAWPDAPRPSPLRDAFLAAARATLAAPG